MYTLIRSITARQLFLEQVPALAGSIVIAEIFYKFHSFTLECLAFLVTWFLIDAVLKFIGKQVRSATPGLNQ
ncbi:MAG TPA: hypothetical protein VJ821_12360 [Anaerolineales bacterium]|nr:hypothetical protein [Anaerolineales bacterium]